MTVLVMVGAAIREDARGPVPSRIGDLTASLVGQSSGGRRTCRHVEGSTVEIPPLACARGCVHGMPARRFLRG